MKSFSCLEVIFCWSALEVHVTSCLCCPAASLPLTYLSTNMLYCFALWTEMQKSWQSAFQNFKKKDNRLAKRLPCSFSIRSFEGFIEKAAARQIALQGWICILSVREERLRKDWDDEERLRSWHVLTFPLNASVFTENYWHLTLDTIWKEEYYSCRIRKQLFLGIFQ